ncbi:nucleotidyl transferase AbiEii/AbiGii toxin family protein [Rhodanobacter caeni]|uniref:Nucleotidyltransferase n=1 Tax=Rhodanobacter caeni TaxID=657654 RepID=A0ABN0US74_9GAMM
MFERPHHQRIAKLLHLMDGELLARAECYFGGGTAIALELGEYRESVDVDFLCSNREGYRLLRNAITPPTLGAVLRSPVKHLREVRTHRDKISAFLEIDEVPIKVEFVLEGRIGIGGAFHPELGVPCLDRDDMYAEKLLANTDRAMDRSQMSRDLIDLAMMIQAWGPIPAAALKKAEAAYGQAIYHYFDRGLDLLSDDRYRDECLRAMGMAPQLGPSIVATLDQHRPRPATVG